MQQIQESIRDAIEAIRLPSIPHVLLRFLNMVEDDDASPTELATLIGQDPALSARFLTVANSPALRRDKEVKSLDQCMINLGTRLARTLAACLSVQAGFADNADEQYYDYRGFWGHSLRVAEMARAIAVKTDYSDSNDAYLAGLMHDIGQLLLLGGLGERYGDLLRNIQNIDESTLRDLEEPLFGTDHAAVGAWLVDQWKLSSFLSDAILFHHKAQYEIVDADPLSKIVWSSHVISNYNEKIDLTQKEHLPDLATVKTMLGLNMADIVAIRTQSYEHVALLATTLGVAEGADARTLPSPVTPIGTYRQRQYDYDPAHSQMEARVRDMAIMQSLQQNLSTLCSEEEILLAVHESARILFGLGRLAFFFVEPDKPVLSTPGFMGQPVLLQRLEIKLDTGRSLAAAVALGKQPCSTFAEEHPAQASLVDVQIARALDSEGVLYVPMCIRERHIGVMAYGLSVLQHDRIQKHLTRMTSFAHQAAVSIVTWREMRNHEQKIAANLTNRFQQHARKVVHEAGNPLSIIKNYLKIVSQKLPDENDAVQELVILREEIDRVALIVQRMSDLTETSQTTATVDINSMIEGMLALYRESLFSSFGITVETELAPSLSPITGNRDSIKQILFNLWKNAAEAMTNGGSFFISTCDNVILNGRLYIEIGLRDSGSGLPTDVMQHLFQPLDPNRRPGHSGIGLSIVASLVERLDGLIKCQSTVGLGTSFTILLPLHMEEPK